jgi:GH15 family glucan-1,4-alpha-glucosidase
VLVLPLLGIEDPSSARVVGTVDRIRAALGAGGPLLYRYPPGRDGLPGPEGAFLPCSFWLAAVLAQQGRLEEAVDLFERLLALRNDLGLLSEEYDPERKRLVGNFPQAFTHLTLVETAFTLARARRRRTAATRPARP